MQGVEPDIRALVSVVSDAADRALALWAGGNTQVRQWEKTPGQPVCEADIELDAMLRANLSALDPSAGWLSEETADTVHRLGQSRVWVVDPIDGTRDYLRGRRGWCVSVALVEDGAVRAGVLAAPARNELWIAQAGQGATRNGIRLQAGSRTVLARARVPADQLPRIDRDLVTVEKPNSIALRMAMVAADEADLVATVRWGNEWDIAAAGLIAQEAGAIVTDALGAPLSYNQPRPAAFGLLCTAPGIHAAATERLTPRAREILGSKP
ncbi:myo-inositol-1(or 4)-monophosphatase [Sphingobium wenxiniae]|uniref:Inositol monophosphatase n=2 Tax=Sphingobium TaxID=165695 RepID=T0GPY8_9SPHN|nr:MULTISPECIES: inositol monophosphatase family protein [Sphingobium]EQB02737.1 inositol monophosphatase [Sphingobium baderi LL03]KMS60607.1 inositol monophosphatase [Sphingobium baderi LL03]MBB6192136.1 myo-inositol-1(or 4)-monophosphatase [Sphingobium wenxiniae]TWH92513.1 myo-inositol-1(or 4)-monophosphatase [Sphingobium wenxiniae]WRD75938.1 3'(2'),5'-bisphosphate nucleotidase CysQ [Sphingobium baderi]